MVYSSLTNILYEQQAYRHYKRIFAKWPVDNLRPSVQLQDFVGKRIDAKFAPGATPPVEEKEAMAQVNALYTLLENRYTIKVRRQFLFFKLGGFTGSERVRVAGEAFDAADIEILLVVST
jgi:hypothetical protein